MTTLESPRDRSPETPLEFRQITPFPESFNPLKVYLAALNEAYARNCGPSSSEDVITDTDFTTAWLSDPVAAAMIWAATSTEQAG